MSTPRLVAICSLDKPFNLPAPPVPVNGPTGEHAAMKESELSGKNTTGLAGKGA
jgi:hypothetical protein